jgi:hypothetical protein
LSKIILFGERSLRRALCEYVEHYHAERNHQGKDNVSCCSLAIETSTARELCNVARGWAGSCVITIKKRREMAGKPWMSPARLVVELRLRNDNYDCWQMHKRIIAELRLRDRSVEKG